MLKHVEDRCLKMDEDELFDYLQKTNFIADCFEEMPANKLFESEVRFCFRCIVENAQGV